MPYPPTLPPPTRTNATPQVDSHPGDHNALSTAISDTVNHIASLETTLTPALLIDPVSKNGYLKIVTANGIQTTSSNGAIILSFTPNFASRPVVLTQLQDASLGLWCNTIDVAADHAQFVVFWNDGTLVRSSAVAYQLLAIGFSA